MKFSKLTLALLTLAVIFTASISNARTVFPALSKQGQPVVDKHGNCVRSKWLADQCCDPCGHPLPPQPEPIVVEKEKKIQYIDLIRQSIYFDIDKDNIDQTDEQRMNDVIAEISKSVAIRDVKMVGYADRFATNKYNIDLSKRRATHVLNYFRGKGFFNSSPVGFGFFGEEKPVTNCPMNVSVVEQVRCLQADRRVDIEVEVLRERIETYKDTVERSAAEAPAYPRPGTAGVEVYSRPVDPSVLMHLDNTPNETPAVLPAAVQQNNEPVLYTDPGQNIDVLKQQ